LVDAARGGDRAAFALLIERHWPMLVGLCRRALADPAWAEEAAQEAALQALLHLHALRQPARFGAWLGGIGLNVCRMWLRTRSQDGVSWGSLDGTRRAEEMIDWRRGPAELAEDAEIRERIAAAVAALPQGQRAAVILFYLAGHTHAETAAALGVRVGAVKTRLHKARHTLRQRLQLFAEEEQMATTPDESIIPIRVIDIRRRKPAGRAGVHYCAVLETMGSGDRAVLLVGAFEGECLAGNLTGAATSRPLPYDLTVAMLAAGGASVREVRIKGVTGAVIYATITTEAQGKSAVFDARPSDALNLALLAKVPIFVDRETWEMLRMWSAHPLSQLQFFGEETEGIDAIIAARTVPEAGLVAPMPERFTVELPNTVEIDFARFTAEARHVTALMDDEAQHMGHHYIGTEHQLLALLRVAEGIAARALASHGITPEKAVAAVAHIVGRGDGEGARIHAPCEDGPRLRGARSAGAGSSGGDECRHPDRHPAGEWRHRRLCHQGTGGRSRRLAISCAGSAIERAYRVGHHRSPAKIFPRIQ
jgi:RNA polymerase sigma factor (sigma-70 family)